MSGCACTIFPRVAFIAAAFVAQAAGSPAHAQDAGKIGILLAAGDVADCTDDANQRQATAKLIAKEIEAAKNLGIPIRVLALGDLAYPKGRPQDFNDCFAKSWGQAELVKYILPVPGNHEYMYKKDAAPYFKFFKDKDIVFQKGPKAGYYSLNFPTPEDFPPGKVINAKPWHLIALNSGPDGGKGVAEDQLKWLKDDLKSNNQRCVLAFAHFFRFSSGRHGHEPFKSKTKNGKLAEDPKPFRTMKDAFTALHAAGASLFVSGHDHHYEFFKRQDADGNTVSNGLRSFIVGTGGANRYSEHYGKLWPNSEKQQAKWWGILKLEVFEDHYSWRFVPIEKNANDATPDFTDPRVESCNTRVSG